jgi:Trk K+ transport system NAD-binding subunit
LIIAASAIGLRLGVISEVLNAEIILVAIVTVSTAPLIFNRLIPMLPSDISRPIIVAGAGQLGLQVAERLRLHHDEVIIVDGNEQRVKEARRLGFTATTRLADCPDEEMSDCFDRAQALVCTHTDSERNYRICQQGRTVYGIDHIVALVNAPADIPRFEHLGVIPVNAVREQTSLLDLLTRNPGMYDILTGKEENKKILEVDVSNQVCSGSNLEELSLPGDVLVLSLRRDNAVIIPDDSRKLELGDHLTLIGSLECIESARNLISG